ncbi:AN1-type zinc finger protein 4 isoform X2 [Neoarius graeffei]|uniref:AN1-type zinc finger protein 4 isoform X2 n=1 Tax=Neoarius graeffei TaxID=443677 RepID=UPI00298C9B7A|nr:AN1-type zinc finger protein 4 isoform X2 [Neoarius graeffei]
MTTVTIENSVKDTSDCLDSKRDEVWEKSLSNKQVTFLVYKEGDQLNVFRVVDRADGSLTPVSKSLSGGSMHNVYAEEEEEGVSISSAQLALENSVTMNKMKLLKAKMENMNLNKKPKKSTKLRARPPVGPRPFCGSLGSARHHRMLRILPQIGHAPATQLPPIGDQQQSSSEAGPPFTCHPCPISGRTISSLTTSSIFQEEEEPWYNPTPRSIRLPPKVSRLELGGAKAITDCLYPPLSVLSGLEADDEAEIQSDGLMLPEDGVMMEPSKPIPFNSLLPEPLSLDVSAQPEASLDSLRAVNEPMTTTPLLSQVVGSDSISTWSVGTNTLQSQSDRAALNLLHPPPRVPRPFTDFTREVSRPILSSNRGPPIPPCPSPQTPPLHATRVDSPIKPQDRVCKNEAQDVTSMANNTSRELSGSEINIDEKRARPCDLSRLCGTNAPLQANVHLLQKMVPLQRATCTPSAVLDSSSGPSCSIKRLRSPTYRLPPVKTPLSSKKKSSKHCFLCGKKTGLATSYECRCGNNFCSTHRYAETHNCTYDYKSTGRRFLQKSNPIISAPKLPKI